MIFQLTLKHGKMQAKCSLSEKGQWSRKRHPTLRGMTRALAAVAAYVHLNLNQTWLFSTWQHVPHTCPILHNYNNGNGKSTAYFSSIDFQVHGVICIAYFLCLP